MQTEQDRVPARSTALTISTIMPVHNGERYLQQALESALAQTEPAAEILVIDDGSTDGSAQVLDRFGDKIRRLAQSRQGPVIARNAGIAASTGDLINFVDADDICPPFRNASLAAPFRSNPAADIVIGRIQQFISPELDTTAAARFESSQEPQSGQAVGGVMIRRDLFSLLGLFRPDLKMAEFMDWYLRAQDIRVKEVKVAEVVLQRRIHGNNFSILNADLRNVEYPHVLRASLARRRGKEGG